MTTTRASYHERVAMRREVVLAVVRRRPGLTTSQIEDDAQEGGAYWLRFGVLGPYNDLKALQAAGLVEAIHVNRRTVLWTPVPPAEPLLWEGDGA